MTFKFLLPFFIFLWSCTPVKKEESAANNQTVQLELNLELAEKLVQLPLQCVSQEYPNKLGQILNNQRELKTPKELHPAFYGCLDWHSSVHGHWLMIRLLKQFPALGSNNKIRKTINNHLTKRNIQKEIAFFLTKFNDSFERTYGWAWILKLHQELLNWPDPDAKNWAAQLAPLAALITEKYCHFLPKLIYPVRSGEHTNTAFGLTFAYDYSCFTKNRVLQDLIAKRAKEFYFKDKKSPMQYEPSGTDFLSPSLEEADLMRRILSKSDFFSWFNYFLPALNKPSGRLSPAIVGDRSDGKLVHLDGLNFSRAWCLYAIGNHDVRFRHLLKLADQHLSYSLPSLVKNDYMGDHWLATFAVHALVTRQFPLLVPEQLIPR